MMTIMSDNDLRWTCLLYSRYYLNCVYQVNCVYKINKIESKFYIIYIVNTNRVFFKALFWFLNNVYYKHRHNLKVLA